MLFVWRCFLWQRSPSHPSSPRPKRQREAEQLYPCPFWLFWNWRLLEKEGVGTGDIGRSTLQWYRAGFGHKAIFRGNFSKYETTQPTPPAGVGRITPPRSSHHHLIARVRWRAYIYPARPSSSDVSLISILLGLPQQHSFKDSLITRVGNKDLPHEIRLVLHTLN